MFISRSETSFLESKIDLAVNEGKGSTILVSGEAGLGKTALVKEFIQTASKKYRYNKFYKVVSASGFCLDMDGTSRSYYPWKEVFIDLDSNLIPLSASDDDDEKAKINYKKVVKTVYDGQGVEWVKLIPVIGNYASVLFKTVKDITKEVAIQKAANDIIKMTGGVNMNNQEDIFIQVMSQFRKLAEKYILIVFVDDIHWFDLSSRDLFFNLAKNLADKSYRMILIGTYRPEELNAKKLNPVTGISDRHPLEEMLINLRRLNAYEECSLQRFNTNQFKNYVSSRFPENEFSSQFLTETENLTKGNVLFLIETINNYVEKGFVYEEEKIYKSKEIIDYDEIPKTISEVIKERFDRLPDNFQEILQIASVMGEDFSVEIIMTILEENQIKFFRKIEKLKNEYGIIEISDKVYDKLTKIYQFVHNLVQKYVYLKIEEEFRIEYHKLVSETIRKFFKGDNIKKVLEQFSFHQGVGYQIIDANGTVVLNRDSLSDDEYKLKVEEYLGHIKELADKYEKAYTTIEGIKRCSIVIDISRETGNAIDEIDYSLKKGSILELTGKWNSAEQLFNYSLKLSGQINDQSRIANSKKSLGHLLYKKGEYEKALAYLNESIILFEEAKNISGVAKNLVNVGNIHTFQGNYKEAVRNYEKALNIRQGLDEKAGIATILMNIGNIHCYEGDYKKAEDFYQRALEIAEKLNDKKNISDIIKNIGGVKQTVEEFEKANEFYEKALKICEELNDRKGIAEINNNIGCIFLELCKYDDAENAFNKAFKIYEELGDKKGVAKVIQNRGRIFLEKCDFDNAKTLYREALSIYKQIDDKLETALTFYNIGVACMETADFENANINLDQAVSIGKEMKINFRLCLFLYRKACICFKLNRVDEALALNNEAYELAKEVNRENVIFSCMILLSQLDSLNDKSKSINALESMLKNFKQDCQVAEINYEIFKLSNSMTCRKTALDIYRKLYEKIPKAEYKKILEELTSSGD